MNHRSSLNPVETSVYLRSPSSGAGKSATGTKSGRDWLQMYAIYGIDEWQTILFLVLHGTVISMVSILLLCYFTPLSLFLHRHLFPFLNPCLSRFLTGFVGSLSTLLALSLFTASANIFHSSLSLHWDMSQRMLSAVPDWSSVRSALDIGSSRGILLNSLALMLKKQGSSGRVVRLHPRRSTTLPTLRTASLEGVQEYVTCKEGDPRTLPFSDNYFDVVASALYLHTVGNEHSSAAAAAERRKVFAEVVRVLKPGGVGVFWDLLCVPEYIGVLRELKMEDIRVSETVTAFMASSQIVSFRKPYRDSSSSSGTSPAESVVVDWRGSIC